jgi:hypothetical protein
VSGTDDKATEEFLNALEEWNPTVRFVPVKVAPRRFTSVFFFLIVF